jgi:hypothetical protein
MGRGRAWLLSTGIQNRVFLLSIFKRLFISLEIEILVKNYLPTAFLIEYLNIDVLSFGFLASQRWRARIAL